jgi:deoxycytidylate deaminase
MSINARENEIVFGFVAPLGTPLDMVQRALIDSLQKHHYALGKVIRISDIIEKMPGFPKTTASAERQRELMNIGTKCREDNGPDFFALLAATEIRASRAELHAEHAEMPKFRRASIIRSLKHPDEVKTLRGIYGPGFVLIGVSAPLSTRKHHLKTKLDFRESEASAMIRDDESEELRWGQQTRDTFELADIFLRLAPTTTNDVASEKNEEMIKKIDRIVDILMSHPFRPPTQEEHSMFLAYGAALRSSDLSRQVGAVIAMPNGDIVALGANEVPSPGGDGYWPEFDEGEVNGEFGGPDYLRGYDSNERERNKIVVQLLEGLDLCARVDSPEERAEIVKKFKDRLKKSGILDLTEFGRAVHAEMAALSSCLRSGISTIGGTLYCTTFPCHNCAKHIIAAGLRRVVYVEPYPKSRAGQLHNDAIVLVDESDFLQRPPDGVSSAPSTNEPVRFEAFEGVGPRRFFDLFSLTLGQGRRVERKSRDSDGVRKPWKRGMNSAPRTPLDARSYIEREAAAVSPLANGKKSE